MRNIAAVAPLIVLLAAFEVYCLVELVRHEGRTLPRWVWGVVILVSIPLGGIVYLVVGRGERVAGGAVVDSPKLKPAPVPPTPTKTSDRRSVPFRSGEPILRTEGLTKRYDEHAALDDVSLVVPRGSVFGVVGPNGAGKTTLLALLAGLRQPTAGTIRLGVDRERIALLPDTPHFEPWLTAREVVDLARQLTRPDAGPDATMSALELAGIADVAGRRTGGFSRGMLQRLGLAATIVGAPELLLLDEPCSALDPVGRREVLDLVGRLGGEHTVLFCSHILDDVQEVCDAVGVLREGRLLFQGPLDELLVGEAAPLYTIRARAPLARLVARLTEEDWVLDVEQLGAEELHVRAVSLDAAERNLPRVLAATETAVVSITPSGSDLERVFLELVR